MTLHQDATVFRQLILLAGEHFNMRPSYIEKDYWVTQFDALWEAIVPTYETEMASLSFSAIPDAAAVAKVVKGLFAMLGKNNHL